MRSCLKGKIWNIGRHNIEYLQNFLLPERKRMTTFGVSTPFLSKYRTRIRAGIGMSNSSYELGVGVGVGVSSQSSAEKKVNVFLRCPWKFFVSIKATMQH